ncbi:hypothetical protein [Streptomyces sp. NPDC001137]|uniref:hypothetical protein n=1 Tax=Streptomyces sp. NPDC001137 TaxID=3154378 RepID=UPI00332B2F48
MRTVTRTFATACALAVLLVGGCAGQDTQSSQEVFPPAPPDDTTSRSIFDSPTGVFDG